MEIDGEKIPFRRLEDAIRIGKNARKIDRSVRLIETERYWFGVVKSKMKQISYNEFDRTNLLFDVDDYKND